MSHFQETHTVVFIKWINHSHIFYNLAKSTENDESNISQYTGEEPDKEVCLLFEGTFRSQMFFGAKYNFWPLGESYKTLTGVV